MNAKTFGAICVILLGLILYFAYNPISMPVSITNKQYMEDCDICLKRGYSCLDKIDAIYPSVVIGVRCIQRETK